MAKKQKGNKWVGKLFKALGIILLLGVVAVTVCYFTVPEVKEFITNSWNDLKFQIKH